MKATLLKVLFCSIVTFSSLNLYAANYFWVGGTGSWTDLNHWATTSGGSTKHTVAPTSADDVFFDANSFTAASQTVTINNDASFKNMDWSAATNNPTVTSGIVDINVFGSLVIPASIARNLIGAVYFKSSAPYNVDLGNLPLSTMDVETLYFQGTGTGTLTGGIDANAVSLTNGTLNTNGQSVTCSVFGTTGSSVQTLNLGASNINVSTWNITSTNITVNAGTSVITSTFAFNGKNLTYNNLVISGTASVTGNNTFNTITLNAGATLKLKEGSTQTFTTLVSNGTAGSPVTIKSITDGQQATLSKASGTVSVNYVRVQDNIATGGATFNAPTGSVNLGNNTGWNITPSTPTSQATSAFVSKALTTSMEVRWTNGNGASRIVLAKQTTAVNANPVDNTSTYTAGAFSAGTQIGTGNYIVYMGNSDRATITGLTAGATYHFAVYEFSGSGATAKYLTTTPARTNTTALPATAVIISNSPLTLCAGQYYDSGGGDLYNYNSSESFTQTLTPSIAGNKLKMDFDTNYDFFLGSGDALKIYDGANTSAALIGTYTGGTSPGVVTATNANGQLTIQFTSDAFVQSVGFGADITCFAPPVHPTQPTVKATALAFSNVSANSMTVSWTNGNGNNRIVIARSVSPVAFSPTDANEYAADASFGSGASLGSNQYVVYNGNGNSVNVTNLSPGILYAYSIFEYNKTASTTPNYFTPGTIGGTTTTTLAAEPTVAASAVVLPYKSESELNVNWTNGNGVRRVVVMKQGSPVDAVPVDGTLYTSTQNFTTGTALGNGNKVVYSGSGGGPYIQGLSPLTTYHFAVFEFNGTTAGTTNYLTTNPGVTSGSTVSPEPTIRPSFDQRTSKIGAVDLNWTKGNAEKILIVARIGSSPENVTDGVEYTANSVFGQGQKIEASSYVIYSGTGTGVTISGLLPYQDYYVSIHGYNGSGSTTNYASPSTTVVSSIKTNPTVQASNVTLTDVGPDSIRVSWINGNGDGRIVVMKAGGPVSVAPKDSIYIPDFYINNFDQGQDLGNGNLVVFKKWSSSVVVKALAPATTYHVAVYEYNTSSPDGSSTTYNYFLRDNAPTASATTLSGKKFYWVNGKGKWSDFAHHWATSSGGAVFYNSPPTAADDVYFDEKSFNADKDSVVLEGAINFKDMDWTKITRAAVLAPKTSCGSWTYIYGSLKLSSLMTINLGSVNLRGTSKNVLDLAGKTSISSCSGIYLFGAGSEWTISNDLAITYLSISAGTLITDHKLTIDNGIDVYSSNLKKFELGNSEVKVSSIKGAPGASSNLIINGGRFLVNGNAVVEAHGAHFKKLSVAGFGYNKVSISGKMTIDTLQIDPGREVRFQSGTTFTIGQLIVNGDSTRSTSIASTIPGSAARFYKADGVVNVKYVMLKDNEATGGAQFNAANSVNVGNVSGWNLTTPPVYLPKLSSSNIQFRKVFRTNLKMKWTSGDGIGRIVVAKQGGAVDAYPIDGTNYTGNATFASGEVLGSGNYVLYSGGLDSVNVSGLTPGKTYHFAVFEFNKWDNKIKYRRSFPAMANTFTVGESDIIFSDSPVTAGNVKFFDDGGNGFYAKNKSIVQTLSPATARTKLGMLFTYFEMPAFDSLIVYDGPSVTSPAIGKFRYTYSKPDKALIATNASGVLTIQLKGNNSSETEEAFKGWIAELFTVGTLVTEPTQQTSSLAVTARSSNSITLKAGKGNGAGRMIIAREAEAVNQFPVDGSFFSAGTQLGSNNYVAYSGADENIIVSGLKQNTIYHFAAVEFNGTTGTANYLLTNPAIVKDTTDASTPTFAASQMTFSNITDKSVQPSFMPGNGNGRIILARKNKEVTVVPVDGKEYYYDSNFGSGFASFGDSTYVIGDTFIYQTYNLEKSSVYYYKVYEYNGSGKRKKYLTSSYLAGSVRTLGPKVTIQKIETVFCPNDPIEVPFVISSAFDAGNKFTLQLSDAQGKFDAPVNVEDTVTTSLSGKIKTKIPNTVEGGDAYKLRIVSSAPKSISDSVRTVSIKKVPDVTVTQEGSSFTSSITSNIQWLKNGVEISGATAATQNFTEPGSYSVKVTEGGCYKTSTAAVILGLEDENSNLKIYPNPVKDQFEIETSEAGSVYVIYDLEGRELLKGTINQRRSIVSSKELPSGIFLIKVTSGKSSSIRKIVKN